MTVHNNELSTDDILALQTLHAQWTAARLVKDYECADKLRSKLLAFGCIGANLDRWHPVFEYTDHFEKRLLNRS